MKKYVILFIISLVFSGCSRITEVISGGQPAYSDYSIKWEEEPLIELAEVSEASEAEKPSEDIIKPHEPSEIKSENRMVYVTKSGEKFHNEDCSALSKSKMEIDYNEALEKGYTPCGKCEP